MLFNVRTQSGARLAVLEVEMRRPLSVIVIASLFALVGCTSSQDPAAFVERYVQLHAARDVDALLALHAPDAEFVIPGQDPIRGSAALRDLLEWDAVLESKLTMSGVRAEGDSILIDSVVERNKWFQALGLSEARFRPGTTMVLRDGRIVGVYPAGFDVDTQRRFIERFEVLAQWLHENRQDALEQLLPGGKFRYDAASARLWLEVFAEWQSSGEQRF